MKAGRDPRRTAWLVTVSVVVTLLVQTALAAPTSGGANKAAKRFRFSADSSTVTLSTADVPTIILAATVNVPMGWGEALIVARYSADSTCNFGPEGKACLVGIHARDVSLPDTITSHPPGLTVFDTDDTGDNYAEGHSMERVFTEVTPGTWDVRVTGLINGPTGGTQLRVSHNLLTVELWRVS